MCIYTIQYLFIKIHRFSTFYKLFTLPDFVGNLIAFLAVPITSIPIRNLVDLSKQSTYSYGSLKGAALFTLFEVNVLDR